MCASTTIRREWARNVLLFHVKYQIKPEPTTLIMGNMNRMVVPKRIFDMQFVSAAAAAAHIFGDKIFHSTCRGILVALYWILTGDSTGDWCCYVCRILYMAMDRELHGFERQVCPCALQLSVLFASVCRFMRYFAQHHLDDDTRTRSNADESAQEGAKSQIVTRKNWDGIGDDESHPLV